MQNVTIKKFSNSWRLFDEKILKLSKEAYLPDTYSADDYDCADTWGVRLF